MAAVNLVSLEVLNHSGKSFRIEFHKKLTQIIQAEHAVISDRSIAEIPMRQLINVAFGHQDNSSVRETALTIDDGGQRVILKRADNRFLINDVQVSRREFVVCGQKTGLNFDTNVGLITPETIRHILNQGHSRQLRNFVLAVSGIDETKIYDIQDGIDGTVKRLGDLKNNAKLCKNLHWNAQRMLPMASDYLKYCYFVCSVRMEKLRRITDRLAPQPIQAAENISVLAKEIEMAQEYMAKTANGLTQLCLPVRDPNAGEKLRTLQQNLRQHVLSAQPVRLNDIRAPSPEAVDHYEILNAQFELDALVLADKQRFEVVEAPAIAATHGTGLLQQYRAQIRSARIERLQHRINVEEQLRDTYAAHARRMQQQQDESLRKHLSLSEYRNDTFDSVPDDELEAALVAHGLHDQVFGRCGDFCRPNDARYATAITLALREYDSMLFVRNDETRRILEQMLNTFRGIAAIVSVCDFGTFNSVFQHAPAHRRQYRKLIDCIDIGINDDNLRETIARMVNNIVVCENLNSVMYVAREHPALRAIYLDGMKCDAFGSIEAYQRDAFAERDTSGAPNYAKRKAATDLHFPRSQTAIANWWPATFSPRPAREQTIAQMRDELNRLIREDVPIHEPEDFAMNTPGVAGDHQRVNEELAVMGVNAFKNFCEANQLLDIRIFEDRRTKLMEHEMHRIKREILVLKYNEKQHDEAHRTEAIGTATLATMREDLVRSRSNLMAKQHEAESLFAQLAIRSSDPTDADVQMRRFQDEQNKLVKLSETIGVHILIDLRDRYSGQANYNNLHDCLQSLGDPDSSVHTLCENGRILREDYMAHVEIYGQQLLRSTEMLRQIIVDLDGQITEQKSKLRKLQRSLKLAKLQLNEQLAALFGHTQHNVGAIFEHITGLQNVSAAVEVYTPSHSSSIAIDLVVKKRTTCPTFNVHYGILAAIALQLTIARAQKWPLVIIDLVDLHLDRQFAVGIMNYVAGMAESPQSFIFINDASDSLPGADHFSIHLTWTTVDGVQTMADGQMNNVHDE